MANSYFNPLNPMNRSTYLEYTNLNTPEDICSYYRGIPSLSAQPVKPSKYYKNDGRDDGHISTFEKMKAIAKGGTYNLVKGLFCDDTGFSIKRTLTTAAIGTALALTGPIGAIIAGGCGLFAAANHLNNSINRAKCAVTDQEARNAYEGIGESASTAGLSLFGGWKGIKTIKNNFSFAKLNKHLKIPFLDKFSKWNAGKSAPLKHPPKGTPVTI